MLALLLVSSPGPLTYATIGLLATFGIIDAIAHFTHYRYGETFSAATWWLERHSPIARIAIGSAIALLFVHIVFHA